METARTRAVWLAWAAACTVSIVFIATYVVQPQWYLGIVTVTLQAIVAGAALVSMVACARRSSGRERRIWVSLLVIAATFLVGAIVRVFWLAHHQFDGAHDPLTAIARWGIVFFLAPLAVMFSHSSAPDRLRGLRSALDSLAMMVAVSALTFYSVLMPQRVPALGSAAVTLDRLILAMVPTSALCIAVYVLVLHRRPSVAWRGCITVGLFAGVLGIAVHDIATVALGPAAENASRIGAGDGLILASLILLGMAGVYRLYGVDKRSPAAELDAKSSPWTALLGSALALVALLLLVRMAVTVQESAARLVAEVSLVLVAGVLAGKEALVISENRILAAHAMADPLTGLNSRRRFMEVLESEVARANTQQSPLALCVFDIVDMTAVNNAYGYAAGDAELRRIGEVLLDLASPDAVAARVAGDDLALLLPGVTAEEAREICHGVVVEVASATYHAGGIQLAVGIAEAPLHGTEVEGLLRASTGAAYWSAAMREQDVVVYDPLLVGVLGHDEQLARLEQETHTKAVELLAAAVDARDGHTRHHSQNTAELAAILAELVGLPPERVQKIHVAGLLHDVGKIGVSDKVLLKQGPLTPDEAAQIRTHPTLGVRIMRSAVDPEILTWVRAHHERWDGNGYPDGLARDEIPVEARILAICDSFDAMRSDRTYRQGRSIIESVEELCACAGSQFDPCLVEVLAKAIRGERKAWFETLRHPGLDTGELAVEFGA